MQVRIRPPESGDVGEESIAMLEAPPREREWISWLLVVLCATAIFVTIPVARSIQGYVSEQWGRETFGYFVIGSIVAATATAFMALWRRREPLGSGSVWLIATSATFIGYTIMLRRNPEEAVHFVEYGLLGVLAFRALSHRTRDLTIYFSAILIGVIVGTLDEAIQWVTPQRVWGLKDIWLNFLAVALTQVAIAKGLRPAFLIGPIDTSSIRRLTTLAISAVVLLGASLLNTPDRIAWYADRVPFLSFLKGHDHIMAEYGYFYRDTDTGAFRSRLSPAELKKVDLDRATESARILDESGGREEFFKSYTPFNDPFVYEARIHLWRRDHYLRTAEEYRDDPDEYRYRLTVAFHENLILEKYFRNTLYQSRFVLSPETLASMQRHVFLDDDYHSAVSKDLITAVSVEQMAWAFTSMLVVLVIITRLSGSAKLRFRY